MSSKITPAQAFDAIKILRLEASHIEISPNGLGYVSPSGKRFFRVDIEWPDGVTRWPMQEKAWRVPTDGDALKRPLCRVRNSTKAERVTDRKLVLVRDSCNDRYRMRA